MDLIVCFRIRRLLLLLEPQILFHDFCSQNDASQILATRSWATKSRLAYQILANRSWLPDGHQILATRFWLPRPGYQILATRSWRLDAGYKRMDPRIPLFVYFVNRHFFRYLTLHLLLYILHAYSPSKCNFRGLGGVGRGQDSWTRAKTCARELASVASRCLPLSPVPPRCLPLPPVAQF